MKDDYQTTFVVDLAPDEVWDALTRRVLEEEPGADGKKHYVLPGFPSFVSRKDAGSSCTLIEEEVGRLLRVKKDDEPCAGTEIVVKLEHAETGTRITIVQSGFGPFLDYAGRDTVFGHGDQIARDFRLFLERGLTVPGTVWGAGLDAKISQTPVGVKIDSVVDDGFAAGVGMRSGDLLLTFGVIRVHDLQQLWTVLALTEIGSKVDASFARGTKMMTGSAIFGA